MQNTKWSLRISLIAFAFLLSTAPATHAGDFSFTPVMVPGPQSTVGFGINGAGNIVGSSVATTTGAQGFLDVGGIFTPIDFPGVTVTNAAGINWSGDIVGTYLDATDNSHGFLATPAPEPSSFVLFVFGLAGVVVVRMRTKL